MLESIGFPVVGSLNRDHDCPPLTFGYVVVSTVVPAASRRRIVVPPFGRRFDGRFTARYSSPDPHAPIEDPPGNV